MTKSLVIGLLVVHIILPVPLVSDVPVAEASIFSAFTTLFTGPHVSADEDDLSLNSQKMPLLEAPANPLASDATSSVISDTTALIPSPAPTPDVSVSSASTTTASDASQNSTDNTITTYKVKSGDNISSIAKSFGITVNTVLWANNLRKDSKLSIGQKLVILPISGVSHTVVQGDTLLSIAKKYNGDVQDIMAYNNMASDSISIGDVIVIPDGEAPATSVDSAPKTSSKPSSSITSKVASVALGVKVASAEEDGSDGTSVSISAGGLADGYYIRPIKAGVRTQGIHGNNAVDLADSCGTPIYASAAGSVTVTKTDGAWNGGYGSYVVISHSNGSQTLYAHMSKVLTNEGDTVTQGQEIGLIGETGKATGCHVHFEIRNGPANPF